MPSTPGLHHVTAIAGNPNRNADFYINQLGLRLVKRTVNHDDKYTYHLYYGDGVGTPGTNITFFPWPDGRRGRAGAGQIRTTAFTVPRDSVNYWRDRLTNHGTDITEEERFGNQVLKFRDPDSLQLELIAGEGKAEPWSKSPVPKKHQLRGFHSVTLEVPDAESTETIITDLMGYSLDAEENNRKRYRSKDDGSGSTIDLLETDKAPGRVGIGSVHHAAFKANEGLEGWRGALLDQGLDPTKAIDRVYIKSVYARIPGGVLFEFATPEPGFTWDEDLESLGEELVLPEWLESEHNEIEAHLPEFKPSGESKE